MRAVRAAQPAGRPGGTHRQSYEYTRLVPLRSNRVDTEGVYQRILVAYDDSRAARRALAEAMRLARMTGAQLTAVAVEAHLPHYAATIGEVQEEQAVEEQQCQRWLKAAAAYASEQDITITTQVIAGHPAEQLIRYARSCQADLLILGHPSHSSLWSRIAGTTAGKLATGHAPCPVLIVP